MRVWLSIPMITKSTPYAALFTISLALVKVSLYSPSSTTFDTSVSSSLSSSGFTISWPQNTTVLKRLANRSFSRQKFLNITSGFSGVVFKLIPLLIYCVCILNHRYFGTFVLQSVYHGICRMGTHYFPKLPKDKLYFEKSE